MQTQTKEVLQKFVERANLLGSATYLVAAKTASLNLMPKGSGSRPEFRGPSREQLEAFVVRLRFFIQNNESTSLANISRLLQNDPSVPQELVQEFETVRADLNKAFDSFPPIRVTSKDDPVPPTWREIWEVFIYGDVAHANQAKRERYERWRSHEPSFILFNYYLSRILSVMASGIVFVGTLFEKELEKSSASTGDECPSLFWNPR